MRVGIIGCGLIGRKRALALEQDDTLVACCDINEEVGKKFAEEFNCQYFENYKDLIRNTKCEIIIISVVNKHIINIALFALEMNCKILIEKPMGRNKIEALKILHNANSKIKVGFNHRFHPALLKAKEIFDSGEIGKLMFIRGVYGHGGRTGMENEWRASKDLCGGGELLDQGVHLIDLSRWFAGDIKTAFGYVSTKFWNIEVEDNAFMLLKSKENVDIQLNVSWTNWKNTFQFEIFGTNGYLKINGLGRWYGKETLEFGKRKPEGGVPNIEIFEYDDKDTSWLKEWQEFKSAIISYRDPIGNGDDGYKANQIIDAIYESSEKNKIIEL